MPIAITPPIVVPSVPQKTYNLWYVANLRFDNLHDMERATMSFDKVPFDGGSDYLWSHKETVTKPFWAVVAGVAGASSVMDAVLNILPAIEELEAP